MFSVEVCPLPTTGGVTGVAVAAVFLLVLGVIVARWTRTSAGRVSFVAVVPLLLLGIGAVSAQSSSTSCDSSSVTTTSTTLAPLNQNLILEIDTSFATLGTDLVYELGLFGDVDVHVDWGDGSPDSDVAVAGPLAHTYAISGQYTITVSGSLTGFGAGEPGALVGAEFLKAVDSFGDLGIESLSFAFVGAENLIDLPTRLPATVTNLIGLFYLASSFNGDISEWDTANVTDMSGLFEEAAAFDGDISGWDTSKVTDMFAMFNEAAAFDGDISGWDTSKVWRMSDMFSDASSFNGDISGWDTSKVTDMSEMFERASSFNGDISGWDTSKVTDMTEMFQGASSFNGDISGWDTSKVINMQGMFDGASSFDQSLGDWDIGLVDNMGSMLDNSALSVAHYDATLIGWEDGPNQDNVTLGASGLSFSSLGSDARLSLNCFSSWQFSGDSPVLVPTSVDGGQVVATGC